jgi:hypothetical protein
MPSQTTSPRTISSDATFLYKVIFPVGWIGGFTAASVALFADANGRVAPSMKWQFLAITLIGGAFFYWTCARLKRVTMSEDTLTISNYRMSVVVPLADLEEVTENRWINIHPVTLHFRRETDFGTRVVFMPKSRMFAFFTGHPVVKELRQAADRCRREKGGAVR